MHAARMSAFATRSQHYLSRFNHYVNPRLLDHQRILSASIHTTVPRHDLNKDFDAAKSRLNSLKQDPGNEAKLELYALYKQASAGPNTTSKPGMLDFVARAKWDAWNGLGKLSSDEAKQQYIDYISQLSPSSSSSRGDADEGSRKRSSDDDNNAQKSKNSKYSEIIYEKHGPNLAVLTFNRTQKRNAFNETSYRDIVAAFDEAANDDDCRILAITGSGEFYSSGNDLGNFAAAVKRGGGFEAMASSSRKLLDSFVSAFVYFPKPLVALVNGPAVGIAVTTLALCDVVYASDAASFHTPFPTLGQSPEGVSSYTFPLAMGPSAANEMLLLGRKISAEQAQQRGLVTQVFPNDVFVHESTQILQQLAESFAPFPESLKDCKRVLRRPHFDTLVKVQDFESETLANRWLQPECMNAVQKFMTRGKK